MTTKATKNTSTAMVIIAFATVYLVWGSTYFFIQKAVQHIPAFIMGSMRFITAGLLMLGWSIYKKEDIWNWQAIKPALISGILLLFIGNGAVIWAEQSLPSSLVAVLVSSAPIWFVLLDKPKWKENFTSRPTLIGLAIGFVGVILLFSERTSQTLASGGNIYEIIGLVILIIGALSWSGGSLYSKYNGKGSATVNTTWQMLAAGIVFIPASFLNNEWSTFQWQAVTTESWLSVLYLIVMGSLAGYSAYVWLLQVRPATQVSTYAYVNPVVAVLLGAFFAGERISLIQVIGLAVILTSVLLINLAKYRKEKAQAAITEQPSVKTKIVNTGLKYKV
ncbi:MAG: EamA family transporter [Chitinophagaceae bacterium]